MAKARESGMPEEALWERFFEPERILRSISISGDVADFGCGYGTFSLAATRLTTGTVYAMDIDGALVDRVRQRAAALGLANLRAMQRDIPTEGSKLEDQSVDWVLLFNILHAEQPGAWLQEARRVLRIGGKVAVMHWIHDGATPRGPPLSIRPREEHCERWLRDGGFAALRPFKCGPYHYGMTARREA